MRKRYSLIPAFIVIIIAYSSQLHAQDGILKGKVKSKEEVLQAATVSAGKKTVLTNEAGEFIIQLKPGIYTLTVSYTSYQPVLQEVKVTSGETTEVAVILEPAEQLNAAVVLGSHSLIQRSSMNTAVPVDVIKGSKLPVAATSLTEQLFIIIPSFNSPPQTVGPTAYVNPATLRGLGSDETLALLNGRRRHTTATIPLQYSLGYGTVATDLNCIPAAAIEEVQILRDGAAAQYGSDGIAGVMDIRLKKSTGRTEANFHLGQFYKGDGQTISFDINRGFQINKKGFINLTLATRFSNLTQRNGVYDGTVYKNYPSNATHADSIRTKAQDDSIVTAHGFDRLNHRRIGSPRISNSSFIVNGGYPLRKKINLFWTGTFNYRYTADGGSTLYRYPKNSATVISALYPDGFEPKYFATTLNTSMLAGIEGQTTNGWNWDISSVYGSNSNRLLFTNTNNASQFALGKNAQTCFNVGSVSFTQNTNNINFTRNFSNLFHNTNSFTISFGGEFRFENYRIKKGEEASWKDYAPGLGKQWGSQGVSGFSDSNAISRNRYVSAVYAEAEMEPNEKFLWNLAGRYEYYNDFGGNMAGKLAMRYKFSDMLLFRSSLSNGFRAPAIQQRYYSISGPTASRGVIYITETFSNDSKTAEAFGIPPLRAEKSINISAGITSKISSHINITLDAYWIQIKDRIILTGTIPKDSLIQVRNILNSLTKNDVASIRFFTNAISTRTKGIDLVATGSWPIGKSFLDVSISANYNKTHIYKIVQPAKNLPDSMLYLNYIVNREERGRLEEGQPLNKIVLAVNYKTGKWEFGIRTVRFGKAAHLASNIDTNTGLYPDEFFSPKSLVGCNIAYSPKSWITIRAGARNIFDSYPDKVKNKTNTQSGLVIYDFNGTQIGYNGGYYFVNMTFSW